MGNVVVVLWGSNQILGVLSMMDLKALFWELVFNVKQTAMHL